jgi:hypothetical protein
VNRPLCYSVFLLLIALLIGRSLDGERASHIHAAKRQAEETTTPILPPVIATLTAEGERSSTGTTQASLLPTVTPTPLTPELWTLEPELHPLPTRYPASADLVTYSGITYTLHTESGFGSFSFNKISPCLCQSLDNTNACAREIEKYLLTAPVKGVVRSEQCLSIDLEDDRVITFNDINAESRSVIYNYAESLPDINYHLLTIGYSEGGQYLLLDGVSGAVTPVRGYPVFSPDNHRFAIGLFPWPGSSTLFVQIWNFAEGTLQIEDGWQIEQLPPHGMSTHAALSWTDPEYFRIRWPIQEGQDATEEVSVALEADGWKVYYQNKPVRQPIVE